MNNGIKRFLSLFFVCILFVGISGCGFMRSEIEKYAANKEQCDLYINDSIKLVYENKEYTVLSDTVLVDNVGNWVGYIRQYVWVNDQGEVILQDSIDDMFQKMEDYSGDKSCITYVIPFYNVYALLDESLYLVVDINGQYHKAVLSNDSIEENVFNFKDILLSKNSSFIINPDNATQLLYGNAIYQVTSETVSRRELGKYLDILSECVTFDSETNKILQKEELNMIDFDGSSHTQYRSRWFYIDVYEISGVDIDKAVAVNVNHQYYVAKKQ